MKDFNKELNFSNDKVFLKNVCLLRELESSLTYKSKKRELIRLRKKIFLDVKNVIYHIIKISDDGIVDIDGIIDIQKFNIYFELAIEIKEKILIPRKITIEQYIESINKTCIISK